jgi:cytochrome c oxidase assembly factor CtaG
LLEKLIRLKNHIETMQLLRFSSWKEFSLSAVKIILFCGVLGIAVKFTTFFNHSVYFPLFPNVLDSVFLVVAISYFFALTLRRKPQK